MNTNPTILERLKCFFIAKKNSFLKNANIVRELVKKNIKIQYRNSFIGVLWTVLNPLLNMLVMFFVFSVVLGYSDDRTYALYILCGNIMFSFIRAATTQSLTSIVNNRGLLTKNKISHYVFPIANNIGAVVNFAFSMIALLGVMAVISIIAGQNFFSFNLLLTFLMLPALFMFSYGISLMLAAMYVFFRDIQHLYSVFLTLWMYLTPIFWKADKVIGLDGAAQVSTTTYILKSMLTIAVYSNPMYHFVNFFRAITYGCVYNGISVVESLPTLGVLYVIGIVFSLLGTFIFAITRRDFIYYI